MPSDEYSTVADVFRAVLDLRKAGDVTGCWTEFVDYEESRLFADMKGGEPRAALRRVERILSNLDDAPKGLRKRHVETLAQIAEENHPPELLEAVKLWARGLGAIA